MYISYKQ